MQVNGLQNVFGVDIWYRIISVVWAYSIIKNHLIYSLEQKFWKLEQTEDLRVVRVISIISNRSSYHLLSPSFYYKSQFTWTFHYADVR